MAHYVMLSSLSESGRKVLNARPGWIRKVNRELSRRGAKVLAQYAVLGPYDFVTVLEAPSISSFPTRTLPVKWTFAQPGFASIAWPIA